MSLVPGEEHVYGIKMVIPDGSHYYKFNNGGKTKDMKTVETKPLKAVVKGTTGETEPL